MSTKGLRAKVLASRNPRLDALWETVPKACRYLITGVRHIEDHTGHIIPLAEATDANVITLANRRSNVVVHEARWASGVVQLGSDNLCAGCRPDRIQDGHPDHDERRGERGAGECEPSRAEAARPTDNSPQPPDGWASVLSL